MALLIKNGRIITATDDYVADIYCEGETITQIAPKIDPASVGNPQVIDASGKYIFPGFIDPHVHIYLPFMGTFAKDDYETASKAALASGTTTLIEMICPGPDDEPMAAYKTWRDKAAKLAAVDFTFHMSVVRFDELAQKQLRAIIEDEGLASFKIFMAYKGALDISDENLFKLCQMAKELGVIITAHCENAVAIDDMQQKLLAEGKTGPEWQEPSRPTCVEAEGVHHLCTFAELTGAHVYCVHTSCDAAVSAALAARHRGVDVWIESVLPHLVLDRTYTELDGFEGAKYVMSPPLRERWNQDVLWNGIRSRSISTIGTDHAPFDFKGQKDKGKDAFTLIPNGIPGIQERPIMVYTHGVCTGRIDLNTFVDACSTQAARIFGMYPRKGAIAVGSDADLVVFDPNYEGTLSLATSHSAVDYNAFEGWPIKGRADVVTVRGEIQSIEGRFVGTHGRGKLVPRTRTHY